MSLFDFEREALFDFLKQAGIAHLPLKGILIQTLYPAPGTRQMSDNDIFYDAAFTDQVRAWFRKRGYEEKHVGDFQKKALSFELHDKLSPYREFNAYYDNYKEKLVLDEGLHFRYHLTDEDFYIFFVIHAYKHFANCGTGIRTLLNYYLLNRAYRSIMDAAYLTGELKKLGLLEYEQGSRALSQKLFAHPTDDAPQLTAQEQAFLQEHMVSTYGTYARWIAACINRYDKKSQKLLRTKLGYVFHRLFLPRQAMLEWSKISMPFVYAHPWLLPAAYVRRFVGATLLHPRQHMGELKVVSQWNNKKD